MKVTHYNATVYHDSTGSSHSAEYPFLPEHGADETGIHIEQAKALIDKWNTKGRKGSIRSICSLRTEDLLKYHDSKKPVNS
jgi:hypothetical protein